MIRIPVRQETESVAVRARQQAALKLWDALRENGNGPGEWHVLYCQRGKHDDPYFLLAAPCRCPELMMSIQDTPSDASVVHVPPRIRHSAQVLVPAPNLAPLAEESAEEWDERVSALFEWVGMACLGAQRCVMCRCARISPNEPRNPQTRSARPRRPIRRRLRSARSLPHRRRDAHNMGGPPAPCFRPARS